LPGFGGVDGGWVDPDSAPKRLASLLLNFNSAALHGNSDGISNQELGFQNYGEVEKSDFFEKIGFLGRSPLNKRVFEKAVLRL
jgi:hypothetical protein